MASPKKVAMADFVKLGMENKYKEREKIVKIVKGGFHGIVLVVAPPIDLDAALRRGSRGGSPAEKVGLRADDLIFTSKLLCADHQGVPRDAEGVRPRRRDRLQFQRGAKLESVKMKLAKQPKVQASN